jgi:SAM-dependent methyltransferase
MRARNYQRPSLLVIEDFTSFSFICYNLIMKPKETIFKEEEIKPTHVDTTEAMRKRGGRTLEDYEEFLGFTKKDLEGKRVLDLGSGAYEKISRETKNLGIKAEVVSLNPDYVLQKYRRIINNQEDWQRKSVAGIGQALPFTDNSFDIILALESITFYEDALHEPIAAQAWAKEVARVLKPGGEARLGEILGLAGKQKQEAWKGILEIFKSLGLEAKIEAFILKNELHPRHRLIVTKK